LCTRVLVFIFSSHCPNVTPTFYGPAHCGSATAMATPTTTATTTATTTTTAIGRHCSSFALPAPCACLTLSPLANLFSVCWHFSCLPSCRCRCRCWCSCCCCCRCLLLLTKGREANANTKTNTRHCHGVVVWGGDSRGTCPEIGLKRGGDGWWGLALFTCSHKSYRLRRRNVTGQPYDRNNGVSEQHGKKATANKKLYYSYWK